MLCEYFNIGFMQMLGFIVWNMWSFYVITNSVMKLRSYCMKNHRNVFVLLCYPALKWHFEFVEQKIDNNYFTKYSGHFDARLLVVCFVVNFIAYNHHQLIIMVLFCLFSFITFYLIFLFCFLFLNNKLITLFWRI